MTSWPMYIVVMTSQCNSKCTRTFYGRRDVDGLWREVDVNVARCHRRSGVKVHLQQTRIYISDVKSLNVSLRHALIEYVYPYMHDDRVHVRSHRRSYPLVSAQQAGFVIAFHCRQTWTTTQIYLIAQQYRSTKTCCGCAAFNKYTWNKSTKNHCQQNSTQNY